MRSYGSESARILNCITLSLLTLSGKGVRVSWKVASGTSVNPRASSDGRFGEGVVEDCVAPAAAWLLSCSARRAIFDRVWFSSMTGPMDTHFKIVLIM